MTTRVTSKPAPMTIAVNDKLLYKASGIFAFTLSLVYIEIGLRAPRQFSG